MQKKPRIKYYLRVVFEEALRKGAGVTLTMSYRFLYRFLLHKSPTKETRILQKRPMIKYIYYRRVVFEAALRKGAQIPRLGV